MLYDSISVIFWKRQSYRDRELEGDQCGQGWGWVEHELQRVPRELQGIMEMPYVLWGVATLCQNVSDCVK